MLTANDVLNDKYIISMFDKIDSDEGLYVNHGKKHTYTVLSTVEKIMKALHYSDEEIEVCKISIALHDVGCSITKKDHSVHSYNISREYLSCLLYTSEAETVPDYA